MFFSSIGIEVETTVRTLNRPVVCDFLPYTKESPLEINGLLLHKDASMLELAMPPVMQYTYQASTARALQQGWETAKAEAEAMLPPNSTITCEAAVEYTNEELQRDPYASVLGCSQSSNIYTGFTPVPSEYEDNLRYGGLHVNLGGDSGCEVPPHYAFYLDCSLGLSSVLHHEQPLKEQMIQRRRYYGRAGEYRSKFFGDRGGLEYRVLPASTWETMGVATLTRLTGTVPHRHTLKELAINYASRVEAAINNCDANEAEALLMELHGTVEL